MESELDLARLGGGGDDYSLVIYFTFNPESRIIDCQVEEV
jgi:hypothetical protein